MKKRKLIFLLLRIFLVIGIPLLLYMFLPIAKAIGNEETVHAEQDKDYIAIITLAIILGIAYKVLYNLYIKDYRQSLLVKIAASSEPNNFRSTVNKIVLQTLNAIPLAILVFILIILASKLGATLETVPDTILLPMGLSWTRPTGASSVVDRSTAALTQIHTIVFFSALAWLAAFGLSILDYVLDYKDFRRTQK